MNLPYSFSPPFCIQPDWQNDVGFFRPFLFSCSLQPDSCCFTPLTYITVNFCVTESALCLALRCFENTAEPFPFSLILDTDSETPPFSLSFSCQDTSVPDGVTITRNGGENLEGIFWGVFIEIPFSLLPLSDSYLCRLSYLRNQTESSPFPNGTALLKIK